MTTDADQGRIEMAEDRLLSRLHDAGLPHADPHIWLFKSIYGAPGPCAPGCALCQLIPHVRAALAEAAKPKVAEVGCQGADTGVGLRMERSDLRAWLGELVKTLKWADPTGATVAQALESCGRPLPERAAIFFAVMAASTLERARLGVEGVGAIIFRVISEGGELALAIEIIPRDGRPARDN